MSKLSYLSNTILKLCSTNEQADIGLDPPMLLDLNEERTKKERRVGGSKKKCFMKKKF